MAGVPVNAAAAVTTSRFGVGVVAPAAAIGAAIFPVDVAAPAGGRGRQLRH